MPYKKPIEALATLIRAKISKSGICHLEREDFALIWMNDDALPDEGKRIRVENFSRIYQFQYVVDYDLSHAVFR
jgi:hypothetical protein